MKGFHQGMKALNHFTWFPSAQVWKFCAWTSNQKTCKNECEVHFNFFETPIVLLLKYRKRKNKIPGSLEPPKLFKKGLEIKVPWNLLKFQNIDLKIYYTGTTVSKTRIGDSTKAVLSYSAMFIMCFSTWYSICYLERGLREQVIDYM